MTPTKILFLDIDGCLDSTRSVVAFNGYPHSFDGAERGKFDWTAVALIRRLCDDTGCSIVLSSDWRLQHSVRECANGLDLPIVDKTPSLPGPRGLEIHAWLAEHPEVTTWAIVDDIDAMLPDQRPRFVQTDPDEGLSYRNYRDLLAILGAGAADAPTFF